MLSFFCSLWTFARQFSDKQECGDYAIIYLVKNIKCLKALLRFCERVFSLFEVVSGADLKNNNKKSLHQFYLACKGVIWVGWQE